LSATSPGSVRRELTPQGTSPARSTLRLATWPRDSTIVVSTYVDLTGLARYAQFRSTDLDMRSPLPTFPAPAAAECCAPAVGLDSSLDASRIALMAKALSEPLRVNLLDVLRRSEVPVCQCELLPLFEIPQSTLSHHIAKLVDAGLVTVERRHKWAYYSVPSAALQELTTWLS
jgi:ArsR family transcriptional regulator